MDAQLQKPIGPGGRYCPPTILKCCVVAELSVNKVTHVGGWGFDVKSISWPFRCGLAAERNMTRIFFFEHLRLEEDIVWFLPSSGAPEVPLHC